MYVGAESILFFFLPLSCFPSHVSKERDGEETGTEHVLVDGKGQNNHNWEMFLLLLSVNITTSAAFHKRWLSFPLRRIKTTWILFIYCIILVFCITYLLYYTPIKVPPLLVWILLPQHWLFTNLGLNALNQQRVENESIPPPQYFWLGNLCVCSFTQLCLCLTPCDPVERSLPGASVHGLSQARILDIGVVCHFLLQGIFLTQGCNWCFLHLLCWQADSLLLSHQGFPWEH